MSIVKGHIQRIIISRTDAIGDVILTLPLCGIIKKEYPGSKIIFLGRTYTEAVIKCCEWVDEFINADDLLKANDEEATAELQKLNADAFLHVFPNKRLASLAKKAGIPIRIGTTNRLFHWGKVNKLVPLSRKNSTLHEAQLNCKLLGPLGIKVLPSLKELSEFTGFTRIPEESNLSILNKTKINVILHPKSNASAREWSLENYRNLIRLLPAEKYNIFISGTDKEKAILSDWIQMLPAHVNDIIGKFSLKEFISFISQADYLVAASTGPLHIAAATGTGAIGIYPPIKPMHPGRWQPIGKNAHYVCVDRSCNDCRKAPQTCHCMNDITAQEIAVLLSEKVRPS
jgi:heptosyltransferase III